MVRPGPGMERGGGRGRPGRGDTGPGAMREASVFGRTFDMMTPHPGQTRVEGSVARPHFGHASMTGGSIGRRPGS
jgi:hypothetical protein